jgi:cytochrome c
VIRWLLVLTFALAAPAFAAGDEQNGKVIYAQCAACHSLEPGTDAIGPNLKGIIGRKAGSVDGYVYSPPMRRSSVTWTAETLDGFLIDPQAVVPGTKMPFSGLPTAKDREDLIAYLSAP